jgi:sulfur carrier protein
MGIFLIAIAPVEPTILINSKHCNFSKELFPSSIIKGRIIMSALKVKMPDMVSVQLDGIIVDRSAFSATPVRENDTVDFLYFMGGGGAR